MKCPLCGDSNCLVNNEAQSNKIKYQCKTYNRNFYVSPNVEIDKDQVKQNRLFNLIFEYAIKNQYADELETPWWFQYLPDYELKDSDPKQIINLAEMHYPDQLVEKIDRILLNLYRLYAKYGEMFELNINLARAFFAETNDGTEIMGIVSLLQELEYITMYKTGIYMLSAKAWQRIEKILRDNVENRRAFVAMAFRAETAGIREAFRKAINNVGYQMIAIDEKEHNNQIVPEIFYEIDICSFLVMDITFPNYGAYYEAGYALGKGKQVIICCRKDAFESDKGNKPHFDVAQKSMIIWKNEDELISKLERRIQATIKRPN